MQIECIHIVLVPCNTFVHLRFVYILVVMHLCLEYVALLWMLAYALVAIVLRTLLALLWMPVHVLVGTVVRTVAGTGALVHALELHVSTAYALVLIV